MREIPKFKIRCSAASDIVSDGRGKGKVEKLADIQKTINETRAKMATAKPDSKTFSNLTEKLEKLAIEYAETMAMPDVPELSAGAKTYCQNWVKEKLYDRRKEFTAKTTDKGNETEGDAIEFLNLHFGWMFAEKNQEHRTNEFLTGTPDIVLPNKIVDIKSSWDCFTFPLFEKSLPENAYYWQVQGYMALWDKQSADVVYCLMDMPESQIEKEAYYKLGKSYDLAQYAEFRQKYLYSHIDPKLRFKSFEVQRNDSDIEKIYSKVEQCRKYINEIWPL